MKASEIVANRAIFGPDLIRITEDAFASFVDVLPENVIENNYLLLTAIHQKLFPHKRKGSIRRAERRGDNENVGRQGEGGDVPSDGPGR